IGKAPFASVIVDLQIIANNKFYDLGTSVIGGDATQDSEMQKRLASFHFLQPPRLSRLNFLGVKLTVIGIIIVGIIFWAIQRRKT
ncbi:MAG TPA: hypothetical protein VFC85_00310, partial [Verrucomicrobiae bacterium]|nr:hypothetical protein [Verrucomicrobiae bacterium]